MGIDSRSTTRAENLGAHLRRLTLDEVQSLDREAVSPQTLVQASRIVEAVRRGAAAGLTVHAGHGLHYHNVGRIAAIADIRELNIGHAIIARAVFTGLSEAVSEMKRLMLAARPSDAGRS